MATPLLGWITPAERNVQQWKLHHGIMAQLPRFTLAPVTLNKGEAVRLFDAWKDPKVVADVGFVFPRFHQLTGSCVGAGYGQADFSLIATQRCIAAAPTKAFLPFWPFNYGRCRALEGDRGRGEGAMGSSIAAQFTTEGQIDAVTPGLPPFTNGGEDGLTLTNALEMAWSDGNSSLVTKWLTEAKPHTGTKAELKSTQDIDAAIPNGYPVTFACDRFIGRASVDGDVLLGHWDSNGGHQQSIHAVWEHPNKGTLYWAQNNWPKESYPRDPAGGPVCGCWVTRANVDAAFRYSAEVFALSHLNWFPAQVDQVLNWAN